MIKTNFQQYNSSRSHLLYLILISFYLILIFFPAFLSQSPLLQTDQPMWTAMSHLMEKEIFPEQKWFWGVITDRAGAGQKMGTTYSISIILPWLFSIFFPAATAVKMAMLFSTLFFTAAFFYVARLYMPNLFALIASLSILTPLFDYIVSGLWYNCFALGCGLIFWISSNNFIKNKSKGYFASAVLFFSLAIFSHPVGVILCFAIFIAYLILIMASQEENKWKLFFIFLSIPCISIFLSFPQLQTILGLDATSTSLIKETRIHEYPVTNIVETLRRLLFFRVWGVAEPSMLMALNILSVLLLCLYGFFSLSTKKDYEKLLPLIALFIITSILVSRIYNFFEIDSSVLRSLSFFYDRFQLLSQIFLILLGGAGMHFLTLRLGENRKRNILIRLIAVILLASLIGIALRTPKQIFIDHSGQLKTLDTSTISSQANSLWKWIAANLQPENERIYFEDTYARFTWNDASNPESTKTHLLALTSVYTDARQIGGWCGFTTRFAQRYEQGIAFGKISAEDPGFTDEFIAERMKLLNSRYIVATSDALITRLKRVPFLEETAVFGIFHIFKNENMSPSWAYNVNTGAEAHMKRFSSTHFEVIAEGNKGDDIHISMAYHPNYIATVEQVKIPVNNLASLVNIKLPANGRQSIHFHYTFNKKMAFAFVTAGLFMFIIMTSSLPYLLNLKKEDHVLSNLED